MADLLSVASFGSASLVDADFLQALWRSPTFLDATGVLRLASPLIACLGAGAGIFAFARLGGQARLRAALHADQRGSATMMDFVLVTPIFVFFMFLVFQYAILAKNHLFTHYAAYQAARSARVYLCPQFPLSIGDAADRGAGIQVCDNDLASDKAELAARLAMIPAAPYRRVRCFDGCGDAPVDALGSMARANGLARRVPAMRRQARYMFDNDNVKVDVRLAPAAISTAFNSSPQTPVIATVEVRLLLLDYIGSIFADGRRRDGHYYTVSKAQVTLL